MYFYVILVKAIQVQNPDLPEKVSCLHGGEDLTGFAEDLQDSIRYDEHFPGHFSLSTYRVSGSEDVRLHFEHQVTEEFWLAFLKNGHL